MRKNKLSVMYVVYKMTLSGRLAGPNSVCEQDEWDEMEGRRPGYHTLIQQHLTSEAEAERLARESPGGSAPVAATLKARAKSPPARFR